MSQLYLFYPGPKPVCLIFHREYSDFLGKNPFLPLDNEYFPADALSRTDMSQIAFPLRTQRIQRPGWREMADSWHVEGFPADVPEWQTKGHAPYIRISVGGFQESLVEPGQLGTFLQSSLLCDGA